MIEGIASTIKEKGFDCCAEGMTGSPVTRSQNPPSDNFSLSGSTIDQLGSLGKSLDFIISAIAKYNQKIEKKGAKFIAFIDMFVNDVVKKLEGEETTKSIAALTLLGAAIYSFSASLAKSTLFILIATPFLPLFVLSIKKIAQIISEIGAKDLEKGAKAIGTLGKSVFKFSALLALSTPFLAVGIVGLLLFGLSMLFIKLVADGLFNKKTSQNMERMNKILPFMALSILAFALVGAVTTPLMIGAVPGLLITALAIAVFALEYWIIGKKLTEVAKGALGVLFIAGSLALFGLALGYAAERAPTLEQFGMLALSLVGIGLVYVLAGKMFSQILLGSLAFAGVGISLMIFAAGMKQVVDGSRLIENPEIIGLLPALIIAIGLAFVLAGAEVVPLLILAGAAAIAGTGAALYVLGSAMELFSKIHFTKKNAESLKLGLSSIVGGIVGAFENIGSVEFLTLPFKVATLIGMGLALLPISAALDVWKNKLGGWKEKDSDNLKYTIQSVSEAFALAGSPEGQSQLFGFPVGPNNTERGIEATMRMGRNLKQLSEGIMAWQNMKITDKDIQKVSDNITRILNVIPGVFAVIGKRERETREENDISFLGISFSTFGQGDIEMGIESTQKMGENLKNLADGIAAWKTMALTKEDTQIIADNISRVLNTIPASFAIIGQRENGSTSEMSFYGLTFANPFGQGDIERGIEATTKLGSTLKDLSDGIMAWKTGGEQGLTPEVIKDITANITGVLASVPIAFARIGASDKETESGGFLGIGGSGDIERGVELMNTLTPTLKVISDMLLSVKGEDAEKKGLGLGRGIYHLFNNLRMALGFAGSNGAAQSTMFLIGLEKSSTSLSGLSSAMEDMGGSLSVVNDQLDRLLDFMDPMERLSKIFDDINKSMKEHVDYMTKLPSGTVTAFEKWSGSLNSLANIDPAVFERNTGTALKNIESAFEYGRGRNAMPESASKEEIVAAENQPKAAGAEKDEKKKEENQLMSMLIEMFGALTQSNQEMNRTLNAIKSRLNETLDVNNHIV